MLGFVVKISLFQFQARETSFFWCTVLQLGRLQTCDLVSRHGMGLSLRILGLSIARVQARTKPYLLVRARILRVRHCNRKKQF